jgi:hypothetical protein
MSGVYDPSNNRLILFGGRVCFTNQSTCTVYNEVWVLTNANGTSGTPNWTQLSPTGTAPDARFALPAAFDSTNNILMIFGGNTSTQTNAPASGGSSETWVLTNANGASGTPTWSKLAPTATPPARGFHSTLYDATNNRLIIFGGTGTDNIVRKDVWILTRANGTGGTPQWTEYGSCSPIITARAGHSAIYSPIRNKMVVFAGNIGNSVLVNDLWTFSGANGISSTPVVSVSVSVVATSLCKNKTLQLRATAKDSQGKDIEGVVLLWISSDTTVLTVSATGLVRAVKAGTATVKVCAQDVCSEEISLTVTEDSSTTTTTPSGNFQITTPSLPSTDTSSGLPYLESVDATGGTSPCTWTATGLPSGFSILEIQDTSTGKVTCDSVSISGNAFNRPALVGTYSVTVTGTDNVGRTATKTFTLTISQ